MTRSEVRRQYGQIYFGDMRGINSLKCKYDASQKLSYIRKMMSDELFDMILDYLSAQEKPAYIIYRIVLKSRSVILIYFLIRAEWLIKRFLSPVFFLTFKKEETTGLREDGIVKYSRKSYNVRRERKV